MAVILNVVVQVYTGFLNMTVFIGGGREWSQYRLIQLFELASPGAGALFEGAAI